MKRIGSLSAVVLAMAASSSLAAEAMRCGSKLITRGDHAAKVLHYCGEPDSVQSRVTHRGVIGVGAIFLPGFVEDVIIEDWTYNLGPHKLMRSVRLENGIVENIDRLGYGYTESRK